MLLPLTKWLGPFGLNHRCRAPYSDKRSTWPTRTLPRLKQCTPLQVNRRWFIDMLEKHRQHFIEKSFYVARKLAVKWANRIKQEQDKKCRLRVSRLRVRFNPKLKKAQYCVHARTLPHDPWPTTHNVTAGHLSSIQGDVGCVWLDCRKQSFKAGEMTISQDIYS